MQAEIVAIGNEVLAGAITNTNAAFISRYLNSIGIEVVRHQVIPDNRKLLKVGLKESLERCSLVIATGGLGSTCDDNTRQVAAELFQSDFRFDKALAEDITLRYGLKLKSIDDQATVPTKALTLKNPIGTAPGLVFQSNSSVLILIPGVPKEMELMMKDQVVPLLKTRYSALKTKHSWSIYLWGVSESDVDPYLRQICKEYPEIEVGIYPKLGSVAVHLRTEENKELLEKLGKRLEQTFPINYYHSPSGNVSEALYLKLKEKKWTLSTAESMTGGAIASQLVAIPGISDVFMGGFVAYSSEMKEKLLGVSKTTLNKYGDVSEPTVKEMLQGLFQKTGSDVGIAISGIAGPTGGTLDKPVGTTVIALGLQGKTPLIWNGKIPGCREGIIERAKQRALGELFYLISTH